MSRRDFKIAEAGPASSMRFVSSFCWCFVSRPGGAPKGRFSWFPGGIPTCESAQILQSLNGCAKRKFTYENRLRYIRERATVCRRSEQEVATTEGQPASALELCNKAYQPTAALGRKCAQLRARSDLPFAPIGKHDEPYRDPVLQIL